MRIHSAPSASYEPAHAEGYRGAPDGADLLIGSDLIHKYFPYLTTQAVAALHVRRAGWLSAQQLGMYLLETARDRGVRYEAARLTGVKLANGHICGVRLSSGEEIDSPIFINAAGPYLKEVGALLPMARYHLPLASSEETIYRATSMYLLAQYFRKTAGKKADLDFQGLKEIYQNMQVLNGAIAERLRNASKTESSVNAVILLDMFALALPMAIEESLTELRRLFAPYLNTE